MQDRLEGEDGNSGGAANGLQEFPSSSSRSLWWQGRRGDETQAATDI